MSSGNGVGKSDEDYWNGPRRVPQRARGRCAGRHDHIKPHLDKLARGSLLTRNIRTRPAHLELNAVLGPAQFGEHLTERLNPILGGQIAREIAGQKADVRNLSI